MYFTSFNTRIKELKVPASTTRGRWQISHRKTCTSAYNNCWEHNINWKTAPSSRSIGDTGIPDVVRDLIHRDPTTTQFHKIAGYTSRHLACKIPPAENTSIASPRSATSSTSSRYHSRLQPNTLKSSTLQSFSWGRNHVCYRLTWEKSKHFLNLNSSTMWRTTTVVLTRTLHSPYLTNLN